ncbi:MAG: hypothetical protein US52_C0064G0005 [candidate division WS6 bacterium GW2011_GWA2_37_6]|uniref:Uncharacterized protein n=1 Tax=candidate division WS6 bacterium GW2011_GWA2_37_6 TaxID=1619087 RepID=A0A0G0GTA6_9BACT|nr:MAG: hypothetical protein US52_C0064G0005 [candidate division WS6 bacterium GW2011_GWA2_37_6]
MALPQSLIPELSPETFEREGGIDQETATSLLIQRAHGQLIEDIEFYRRSAMEHGQPTYSIVRIDRQKADLLGFSLGDRLLTAEIPDLTLTERNINKPELAHFCALEAIKWIVNNIRPSDEATDQNRELANIAKALDNDLLDASLTWGTYDRVRVAIDEALRIAPDEDSLIGTDSQQPSAELYTALISLLGARPI